MSYRIYLNVLKASIFTERLRDLKWKKILKDFGECHENSLIESFKMSPHLICLSWGLRSLLWPASGSGLDVIWKLIPQLRHIKWGLILKLSLRPFLSHHLESLRIFFHFMSPCRAVQLNGISKMFDPFYLCQWCINLASILKRNDIHSV